MENHRQCKICGKVAALSEFATAGHINDKRYYRHKCIKCYHKAKTPRKAALRNEYYNIKKTLKCAECGNNDFRVLEFDHLNRATKSFNVSDALAGGYSLEKVKAEIKKCQVLCANCHRIKTYNENNLIL